MARPDSFTKDEIQWLKENYPTESWDVILSAIPKTKIQIVSKAHKLGIKRSVQYSLYTKEEDDLIKETYDNSSFTNLHEDIQKLVSEKMPHRTVGSVMNRAQRLGYKVRNDWTDGEEQFLRDNYTLMTVDEMASRLERHSRESVYQKIRKLGLTDAPMFAYSEQDKQFIADNYLRMSDDEIGEVLHRKPQSIKEYRRKLKLYKPKPEGVDYGFGLYTHKHNTEWKMESTKNCNYKCVITKQPFDDIHHLMSRNLIIKETLDSNPDIPSDINFNECDDILKEYAFQEYLKTQRKYPLGVCLTHEMHKKFHDRYGYGNNTPEQFYEFVKSVAPDRLDEVMAL